MPRKPIDFSRIVMQHAPRFEIDGRSNAEREADLNAIMVGLSFDGTPLCFAPIERRTGSRKP